MMGDTAQRAQDEGAVVQYTSCRNQQSFLSTLNMSYWHL